MNLPVATLRAIVRIVLLYAVGAGLWILLSDDLMARLLPDIGNRQFVGSLKGLLFVAVTSLLLFLLLLRFAARREAEPGKLGADGTAPPNEEQRIFFGIPLLSLGIALLVGYGLQRETDADMLWIALASMLVWVAVVSIAVLAILRRQLQISQQQRARQREKLHELRLLDAIADSSDDAIFALDAEGRFILFNPAAERLTGKPSREVLGRDETAAFPPDVAARLIADNRQVMSARTAMTFEDAVVTPDGARTFLTTKAPLRDDEGHVVGLFGIARDISARARDEDALRRSHEELQRLNRAMIGRELDMVRLKREINELARTLGRPPPHDLDAIDAIATASQDSPEAAP